MLIFDVFVYETFARTDGVEFGLQVLRHICRLFLLIISLPLRISGVEAPLDSTSRPYLISTGTYQELADWGTGAFIAGLWLCVISLLL